MTKAEIVNEISGQTGIEKPEVLKIVESVMETIKGSMVKGENIYLRGFGSFVIKKRADKTARNISTNSAIIIPAHYVPSFKPAEIFVSKIS
jgi:DNA-binding protein HU-beta